MNAIPLSLVDNPFPVGFLRAFAAANKDYERAAKAFAQADYPTALHWFEKAAGKGHADANFNLGLMYHLGTGVDIDFDKAMAWYRKASEEGRVKPNTISA